MKKTKLAGVAVAALLLTMGSAGAQTPSNDGSGSRTPGSNVRQPTKPGMENGVATPGPGPSNLPGGPSADRPGSRSPGAGSGSGAPGNEPSGKPPAMGGHESGVGGAPGGGGAGGAPGGPAGSGTPGAPTPGGMPEGAPR